MPRAVGVRREYAEVPAGVRSWVDEALGSPVVRARTQFGGMSPGCAARVRTRDGATAFVKAVGTGLNAATVALFRHEIDVLSALPAAPYRPGLLATYDDGDWVGLLLADIEGRYPDLDDPRDAEAVWGTVLEQSRALTPAPMQGIASLADTAERHLRTWTSELASEPGRYLPPWMVGRFDELHARVGDLPGRLPSQALCHWDLRDDNLLLRPDGAVVVVDWGMARLGPAWADAFNLALHWVAAPHFEAVMTDVTDPPPESLVTDCLVLFGGRWAWQAAQPAPPGLPAFPALLERVSREVLVGARRRLTGS